jgi:hypothetical protein
MAGRFDSAACGCAAQQITRRVLLSHAILDADYEQVMADGQTFLVLSARREPTPWSGRFLVIIDKRARARASSSTRR